MNLFRFDRYSSEETTVSALATPFEWELFWVLKEFLGILPFQIRTGRNRYFRKVPIIDIKQYTVRMQNHQTLRDRNSYRIPMI